MVHLTLSDEDARRIAESSTPVIFVDRSGRRLGQLAPVDSDNASQPLFSAERLAELQRRAKNPGKCSSLQEIKERLKRLED